MFFQTEYFLLIPFQSFFTPTNLCPFLLMLSIRLELKLDFKNSTLVNTKLTFLLFWREVNMKKSTFKNIFQITMYTRINKAICKFFLNIFLCTLETISKVEILCYFFFLFFFPPLIFFPVYTSKLKTKQNKNLHSNLKFFLIHWG